MLAVPLCHDEQSDDQNEAYTNTVQHEYNDDFVVRFLVKRRLISC